MYSPTREEQETIIRFDRSSDTATIYTADPVIIRKMDKLMSESPCVQAISHDELSRTYICPKSWVKVHKPRLLRDEQRAELTQRLKREQQA